METTVAVDLFQSCWMGGIIGGVITVWTAIGGTEIGFVRAKANEGRGGAGRGECPTVRSMKGVTLGVAATGGAAARARKMRARAPRSPWRASADVCNS